MKILMIQPNYHSGGAEIAGNWTPSWVAYIGGALKQAGFNQVKFVDAMADDLPDETIEDIIRKNQPDVVMTTNITPSIFKAQDIMKTAKKVNKNIRTIMGGIHSTFMYPQVLTEAPETDYVIRGEGEEVAVNLMKSIAAGTDKEDRADITGIAYLDDEGKVFATAAHPVIEDLDTLSPDWSLYDWDKYIYTPLNCRLAVPNFARGCPFTCTFCSQWQFWRRYRARSPKHFVDEIEILVKQYKVGFFILADEEPTINKQKFVSLCQELIDRNLDVHWGINTRVTDIMRDEDLLPFYRKAGLVHVSLGTEAASQMNLNRFRKETTIDENKYAIKLLQKNGIVAEAQFVMGLEHETPETIEETYQLCKDWDPDMANWTIYTPWPFSDLFKELGDRVEVRDYSRYNFVSPIIKPDNMEREDVLKGVLKSYGRFYARKTFFSYPWIKDPYVRKYMLGCLKAFAQTTLTKRFYDIDRVKTKNRKIEVDLGFDQSRILTQTEVKNLKELRPEMVADMSFGLKEAGYQREHDEHNWDEFDESTIKDRTSAPVRNC